MSGAGAAGQDPKTRVGHRPAIHVLLKRFVRSCPSLPSCRREPSQPLQYHFSSASPPPHCTGQLWQQLENATFVTTTLPAFIVKYFKQKFIDSIVFSFQLGNAPDITCMCMIALYILLLLFYFMPRVFYTNIRYSC